MVVFRQKWFFSGKSGCILANVVVLVQIIFSRVKVVVFWQSGCIRAKVVIFGQSGCIRANVVLFG